MENFSHDRYSNTYSIPRAFKFLECILSAKECDIIAYIVRLSDKYEDKGGCTLKNEVLADIHQCGKGTVSQAISKASQLGFLIHREDFIERYPDGTEGENINQKRRLIMHIPVVWEFLGQVWAKWYFARDPESLEIMKSAQGILLDTFGKEDFQEQFADRFWNTPPIKKIYPPYQKNIPPLFQKDSLIIFSDILFNKYLNTSPNGSIGRADAYPSAKPSFSPSGENGNITNPEQNAMPSRPPTELTPGSRKRVRETPFSHEDSVSTRVDTVRGVTLAERKRLDGKKDEQILHVGEELYLGMDFAGLLKKVGLSDETIHRGMPKDIEHLGRLVMEKFEKKSTVEGVIRWLHSHHGDQFVPSITSACELKSKFPKVQAAMARPPKQYDHNNGGNNKRRMNDFNFEHSKDFDLSIFDRPDNRTHEQRRR